MHSTIKNLLEIEDNIKFHLNEPNRVNYPKIIAVEKWTDIKKNDSKIKLHMIGKLQTNKVKFAVQLFDYIHSVDSEKLAKKIADEQLKAKKKNKNILTSKHWK